MSRRTIVTLTVLAALAALSFFLSRRDGTDTDPGRAELPEGYYLTEARLEVTDANGVRRYELRARRIDHRPAAAAIDLADLQLDYGIEDNLWRLTARSGRMPSTNDHIQLDGGVVARLLNPPRHGATQLSSERLYVDIDAETAHTDDPVTVEFDGGTLEAVGLTVDLTEETLRLHTQVRGEFVPPTR